MPKFEEELDLSLELSKPKMFKVILHNDDYTSMDFVIMVLTDIFHLDVENAHRLMIQIHEQKKAICGIYTFEIAQMKVHQVTKLAKENEFPLLATLEEDK